MDEEKKTLKELGLTKNEIEVYMTLLKLGQANVSLVAERSGIYRPYVYDTLERLQEKGLVSFIIKESKRFFQATNPSQLLEIEREKLKELEKTIPKLNQLISLPKEETKIQVYLGKKVVRIIQKDVLKTLLNQKGNKKENLVIGVDEKKFMETDPVIMEQFFFQIKKHKLKERVLVRKGDTYLPAYKSTTTYKFLPKEFFDPTSTFIYGNKVAIIIFGQPLYALIIESKILSKAYRKQFDLLWKIARKRA